MKLSKNVEYGIIALTYLAENKSDSVSVKRIANETEIPEALLAKIFQNFVRTGILNSFQGKKGGYKLSLKPNKITLADIMQSLSEEISIAGAVSNDLISASMQKVQSRVEKVFYQTKLSDLIKNYKENIMKYLDEILQNKVQFFKFMSKSFPVKYKSNIFLRDVQFAIKKYFEPRKIKLSYTETENMAIELMRHLVEKGEAEQLTNKSWEFLLKIDE